jgi:hypothetical protein
MAHKINPKMQPDTKIEFRAWQDGKAMPEYAFGECPTCGTTGYQEDSGPDDTDTNYHVFFCNQCNITYTYLSQIVYRFEGIEPV